MKDVRKYIGVFTGKTVKPENEKDTLPFKKGDRVIVLNANDYKDFLNDWDKLSHGSPEEVEQVSKKNKL